MLLIKIKLLSKAMLITEKIIELLHLPEFYMEASCVATNEKKI